MPEVLKICIFPQKIRLPRSKWCGEKRLTHKVVYKNLQETHFICLFVYLFIYLWYETIKTYRFRAV